MTDETPIDKKVVVLNPNRPPAQESDTDPEIKKAMRRLLAEWKQKVDNDEIVSLVLIGGMAEDGRTVDAYACKEDPLTTLGRIWRAGSSILATEE